MMNIASNPALLRFGAKMALRFAPRLVIGNTALFSRWDDVQDILSRDLDFVIEPVNKDRIERVNGPFILGLDRSDIHLHEREALYKALKKEDLPRIQDLATNEAQGFLKSVPKGGVLDVVNGYARRVASRSASALMGIKGPSEDDQMRVARAMFHELFLNLGGDEDVRARAVAASKDLRQWCNDAIAHKQKKSNKTDDMIDRLIALGTLDEDGIRRTVSGMFVGAIDTTTTCVAQIMTVILGRRDLHHAILNDLDNPDRMRRWCWEALRFWPHNPVILRQAARDTTVGGRTIKAGTTVFCVTLAAMHDKGAFPHPDQADPARADHLYLHFGGGLHPCAGRAVNGVQIPLLVTALLRRMPVVHEKIVFSGPFPDKLLLKLEG